MSSTEATAADGGTTGTSQTRTEGSTAAERLSGPIEGEQSPDTTRETETDVGRRADTATGERDQSPEAGRRGETAEDRPADTAVREGEQSRGTASRAERRADDQADTGARQRTTLIAPERAESYNNRWNELKGLFVDEPRGAVRGANELVGEVLDELEELFRGQRADLEHGLDSEQTTTEDLRQALGRYRSFFDRLLSF